MNQRWQASVPADEMAALLTPFFTNRERERPTNEPVAYAQGSLSRHGGLLPLNLLTTKQFYPVTIMIKKTHFILTRFSHFAMSLCLTLSIATTGAADAAPQPVLSVNFDGNTQVQMIDKTLAGKFAGKPEQQQYVTGVQGKALVTGEDGQYIHFNPKGNFPQDQWTVNFWVKGIDSENAPATGYRTALWGFTNQDKSHILFYRREGLQPTWRLALLIMGRVYSLDVTVPSYDESQWHQWTCTWSHQNGARVFLDGQLVGTDAQFGNPSVLEKHLHNGKMVAYDWAKATAGPVTNILLGQRMAGAKATHRIIDEFNVYNTVLGSSAIARLYYKQGNISLTPKLTIAPAHEKIVIDGNINDDGWQDAAGFAGLIDGQTWQMQSPQTWGAITYDKENLYLALHSTMPQEALDNPDNIVNTGFLKTKARQHDGAVGQDDSFVWQISPPGQNAVYNITINSLGIVRDARHEAAQEDLKWDSQATVKSIANLQGWTMEVSIPLKQLGITQIDQDAAWGMNFIRNWKQLRQQTGFWAMGELGQVHFADQGLIAKVTDFEMTLTGKARASLELHNAGSKAATAQVKLQAGGHSLKQQSLSLAAGQSQKVILEGDASKWNGALAQVSISSGANQLLQRSVPILLSQSTGLRIWKYPSRQQIRLGWTINGSSMKPRDLSMQIEVANPAGKVLLTQAVDHLDAAQGSALVSIKDIPDGKYDVNVAINHQGATVQDKTLHFTKQPLPRWLGNTFGLSDTPPAPWTDVKVSKEKDSISIWGRDYVYGNKLLPDQIINQDTPMLAAPMHLRVQTKDATSISGKSKADDTKWTKTTATRADSLRQQKLGSVSVEANSYVEFDGMTWLTLTVTPTAKQAHLQKLSFNIPLKAEWSKLINTYDYTLHETGLLPEKGWSGTARPVWVGNGDGGIQVFQESSANWIGSQTIEVLRDDTGQATIRLNLIDQETTLNKPITFAFGWMASPTRPAPKEHRDWRYMGGNPEVVMNGKNNPGQYAQKAHLIRPDLRFLLPWFIGWNWIPERETYKGRTGAAGTLPIAKGPLVTNFTNKEGLFLEAAPYVRLAEIGTANKWFSQFGDEWSPDVNQIYEPDLAVHPALRKTVVSQSSRSLRDFFAWGLHQVLNQNDIHALYFDVAGIREDNNIYHGAGIPQAKGAPAPERNILGTRMMFRRIYTMLKAKDPNAVLFYHASGRLLLPVASFCDVFVDGENLQVEMHAKKAGYRKILNIDQFRAGLSAQNNFGPSTLFLPEYKSWTVGGPDYWKEHGYGDAEYLWGLCLLHDTGFWWSYFPNAILKPIYLALDKTGWNADWEFIPYWNQTNLDLPPGIKASMYVAPDKSKAIIVMMNTTDQDQTLNVAFENSPLNGKPIKSVQAIYPDEPMSVKNGAVQGLTVGQMNFRAFVISP